MTVKAQVTPTVLQWARETGGFSEHDVAKKLNQKTVTVETITQWEQGMEKPSYAQLGKLARLYKRPLAVFFFPDPPEGENYNEIFRAVPADYATSLPPHIRYIVRQALARRMDLYELHQGKAPEDIHRFNNSIRNLNRHDPRKLAAGMRDIVGVSLQQQYAWQDTDAALRQWRKSLQNLGIWIFKDAFDDDNYCGFFLPNDDFPIIYINNSMSKSRQIFTLFHELGHLLIGKGGVDFRENFETVYQNEYRREEVFCNAFAGAFLVPDNEFSILSPPDKNEVEDCAKKFSVSPQVIWRKCMDWRLISQADYNNAVAESKNKKGKSGSGGNYYLTRQVYLGERYLNLAFKQYYKHHIDEYQLADYLNIKVKSIPDFEKYALGGL